MKVPVRYRLQWHKTTVSLVAGSNLEKTIQSWLKIIALLQNCKMKQKKIVVVLKFKKKFFLRKLTEMSNLILCFSEVPKIFICFRVRQVAFLSEDWTKVVRLKKYPLYSFRFSSISPCLYKCVKGKHIENKPEQTCLSFSTTSPR